MVNPIVGQVKARADLDFATTTQYRTRAEVYINIYVTDTNEAPALTTPPLQPRQHQRGAIITGSDGTLNVGIAAGNSAGIFKVAPGRRALHLHPAHHHGH